MSQYPRFLCVLLLGAGLASGCSDPSDPGPCEGCVIDGFCYPNGVANPAEPCQVCDASALADGWSPADGASCDDGVFCNGADTCRSGACAGHAGSPCGAGLVCHEEAAQCAVDCPGCRIAGVCVWDGQRNPGNACQICDPTADAEGWTDDDGADCDDGRFCNGADTCQGGACVSAGDPCDSDEVCREVDGGQCCGLDAAYVCDASGDLVEVDACGHWVGVAVACSALGLDCQGDSCVCDVETNAGCQTGERCATVQVGGTGSVTCVADGTALVGDPCTRDSQTGIDNCADGGACRDGDCEAICDVTTGSCAPFHECVSLELTTHPDVGSCQPRCNAFANDCPSSQACYVTLIGGQAETQCFLPVPEPGSGCAYTGTLGGQGDCCSYLNTCVEGYSCLGTPPGNSSLTCALQCDPTDTVGSSDCTSELGAGFYCVSFGAFWGEASASSYLGLCVEEALVGPATCFNGVQDGLEDGVDCCTTSGGSCPCAMWTCP